MEDKQRKKAKAARSDKDPFRPHSLPPAPPRGLWTKCPRLKWWGRVGQLIPGGDNCELSGWTWHRGHHWGTFINVTFQLWSLRRRRCDVYPRLPRLPKSDSHPPRCRLFQHRQKGKKVAASGTRVRTKDELIQDLVVGWWTERRSRANRETDRARETDRKTQGYKFQA